MSAPAEIIALVERFEGHRESYASGNYNETQLRREFLDPFFAVLGWDVENKQGYAEAYKDVVHEDAIKVGSFTKAPDYSFRIGGTRKFFVELPLSILTDFEEFAAYDCRIRPRPADKTSTARIMYLRYTEYESRWDEIASSFSREAVLKGLFDKYAEGKRGKRGTTEVDVAFLGRCVRMYLREG